MKNRATILMYHSINDDGDFFSVSPKEFLRQMQFLSNEGYKVISLEELAFRLKQGKGLNGEVVITFDDGYRDNFTNAYPVLKRLSFPATIFMITDLISGSSKSGQEMLTDTDLKEMHGSGLIAVEPHSVSHPKLAPLTAEKMLEEVKVSKETLEKLLNKVCTLFAYPYGNYSEGTAKVVSDLKLFAAVTVEEGTVTMGDNPFLLKRNSIDHLTTWPQFVGKLSGVVDRYKNIKSWF